MNTFEIRGASLFFVFDHAPQHLPLTPLTLAPLTATTPLTLAPRPSVFRVKLIDLSSFEETGGPDAGFLHGLATLEAKIKGFQLIDSVVDDALLAVDVKAVVAATRLRLSVGC